MSEKKSEGQIVTELINSDTIRTVPPDRIKHPKVTSIEAFKQKKGKSQPPKV